MYAAKFIILILILNLSLPFYAGSTTSALEGIGFLHYHEESSEPVFVLPSPKPSRAPVFTPLPANTKIPIETAATPSPVNTKIPIETLKPSSTPEASQSPVNDDKGDLPAVSDVLTQELLNKVYKQEGEKVAYLTFDDGPTPRFTNPILDILKEENIKATFFTIGTSVEHYPDTLRRIYEEGHGIGNHTYSHVFKNLYSDPDNFLEELYKNEKVLQVILDTDRPFRLVRFPGGSFGKKMEPYRKAVNDAGFVYTDWNCISGDAESVKAKSPKELLVRLKETAYGHSSLVVLMHDAPNKENTVKALPSIIEFLRSEGCRFELLPGSR